MFPPHPSQWHLFGAKWREKLYFVVQLTFGCRSIPKMFDTLSEALCWFLVNNCKLSFVLHLPNDFLLIYYPDHRIMQSILTTIGVPLAEEKTSGPLQSIEFSGIILDSDLMRASLPLEKLNQV